MTNSNGNLVAELKEALGRNVDLEEIEPFTLVLFQEGNLYQLRWNEIEKSTLNLDVNQKHIWSSSTLYPKEIRKNREIILFNKFRFNIRKISY